MTKRFQSRRASHAIPNPTTRWLMDPSDAMLLERLEQTTLSAMVAGCSPEWAQGAVVEFLAGRDVSLQPLANGSRRALARMLDCVREAANASIKPALVASVCTDAMGVGQLLREAFTQGFEAGRAGRRTPDALH